MMNLLLKKQIYMVVGYMLSKLKNWFILKFWTIWYYVWNPGMYFKRIKLRNKLMIDNEYDDIDFRKMASWLGMAIIGGLWWYSVFTKGFFITIVWSIVIMAIGGLWLTIKDMRL